MMRCPIVLTALLASAAAWPVHAQTAPAPPPGRRVGDVASILIDPAAATRSAEIGLDRAGVFARMAETSIPETS